MSLLIFNSYLKTSPGTNYTSLETGIRNIPTDSEWMIIYQNGNRMGYAVNSVQNLGSEGYRIDNRTQLSVTIAGMEAKLSLETLARVDTLFRLITVETRVVSDLYSTKISAVKTGNRLSLTFIHGNDTTRKAITVPRELYSSEGIQALIARQGIRKGQTVRLPALDPMNLEVADLVVTHLGKEDVRVGGTTYHLNKLQIVFKEIPSTLWLDDDGQTYREETIMGMRMERTTPELALSTEAAGQPFDLLGAYAIPADQIIRNPRKVKTLTIEIEGLPEAYLKRIESPRQTLVGINPLRLQINTAPYAETLTDSLPYLAANEFIQADHPRIRRKSTKILEQIQDPDSMVQSLREWVFGYLKKWPVVNFSSALEILDHQEGDCSEHTVLFTALSRARGIPTKVDIGVVYQDGRFLYHAWPVVHVNGQWTSLDPTFNEPVADATHIAFLENDFTNLTELIPVLGQVSIRILNAEY